MSVSEDERTEFHDRNETEEIHDFYDWIATVEGGVLSLDWFLSGFRNSCLVAVFGIYNVTNICRKRQPNIFYLSALIRNS